MIDRLTTEEKTALMELLIYLVKSDGRVEPIEKEVLQDYANLVGVDIDNLKGDLTPEELVPLFQSPTSGFIVLQEVMRLARLDGAISIPEQSAIIDIASMMGFPMRLIGKMEQWVDEGLSWTLRGEDLLEEAGHTVLRKH